MNIFHSKEKWLGFDDRLMVLVGIPIITLLVDALLFGSPAQTLASGLFWKCFPVGLIYTTVLWISFREVMCYGVKKLPHDHQIRRRQILSVIALIVGFFLIDFIIDITLINYLTKIETAIPMPDFSIKIIVSLIFSFLIYGIYEGIYLTKNIARKKIEREQLLLERMTSQLSGLRAQINPHFLFNSLNTLSSLVHEDTQRADNFIGKLSKVYRYMLEDNDEMLVPLADELQYLDAYKHLLKERFGNNLIFVDTIKSDALRKYIVPLSLQIVFENCVKHNVATSSRPLTITMTIDNDSENITISNNLQMVTSQIESNGVGLENIKKRYSYFTDRAIEVRNDKQNFEVVLPLLFDNKINVGV